MPKIVDHDAYRLELASRAVHVFRELGYHGLGMRQIADELGVSKSALYHYFASKKDLFEACSKIVSNAPLPAVPEDASSDERYAALISFALELDTDFLGELSLLIDYIRPLTSDELRGNETLRSARRSFETSIAGIVGSTEASATLNQLLGILVMRVLDGGETGFESLRPFCAVP
ncbi:MAG: AcrR family transcriptional regulator [Candidatus Poriferisodalaceae bacterium]